MCGFLNRAVPLHIVTIGVPLVAVAVVAAVIVMAVVGVAVAGAAGVMAPGKGSGKNPEKFSLRRKGGFPSGFLMQEGARVGVISAPIDALPA